ncbi:uncharacterized protein B0I36DRAFT_356890 [Microdochium trichocladiopsis]|uniref:Uncharacterized protein n=1 Tax=Microdochium trichocladiopsis TaxID=1682393 RepID=A0A9P9BHN0_9PEZI|nr:uncharacterized protein B0I36DRAFT_356890 [Microdochium trichocladiopsis]KAH7007945.1 hypothetical protein B0I36DRAFT_356890 [Microdochium trichocladiopsis]
MKTALAVIATVWVIAPGALAVGPRGAAECWVPARSIVSLMAIGMPPDCPKIQYPPKVDYSITCGSWGPFLRHLMCNGDHRESSDNLRHARRRMTAQYDGVLTTRSIKGHFVPVDAG